MTAPAVSLSRATEEFSKLGTLVGSILRRDRVRLAAWFLGLVVCIASATQAMAKMFSDPTSTATVARAQIMATPTGQAFGGPGYGIHDYTLGAIMMNELLMSTLVVMAIMSILLVIRWTRGDEETGRGELVGAACTGRSAQLTAAIKVGFGLNLAIALGLTGGLMAQGLALSGSLAFGLGAGLTGWFFVGLGAVAAQVFTTGRAAASGAMAVMGLFYLIRVAGDVGHAQQAAGDPAGSPLSWFSPFAWPTQTRAFVELRWWPLIYSFALALILAGLAAYLLHKRDFGAGLVQPKAGRAQAKASLRSPMTLNWRLERSSFTAWAIGAGLIGLSCGFINVNTTIKEMLSGNATLEAVWGGSGADITSGYYAILLMYGGVLAIAFAMNVVAHLHSSETKGLTELQLSTPVSRPQLMTSGAVIALAGGVAILVLTGLTLAVGAVPVNGASWWALLQGGLVLIPALLVFVGLGLTLLGWAPRAVSLMWVYLVYAVVARLFGAVLNLPAWAVNASVLAATPTVPAEPVTYAPLVVMTVVGVVLVALGYAGYRRRNIITG